MSDVTWLTQQAYDNLHQELTQRQGPTRKEISAKIGLASDEGVPFICNQAPAESVATFDRIVAAIQTLSKTQKEILK